MTTFNLVKLMSLTAIGGAMLAALLVMIITKLDDYYDPLLMQQSVWLGLLVGLLIGASSVYYQAHKTTLKATLRRTIASAMITTKPNPSAEAMPERVEQATIQTAPVPSSLMRVWGGVWRGGLASLIGLLLGAIGGIWYCVEQYSNLSSDAQGWLIFYAPVYLIIILFYAGLGLMAGVVSGMVWGFVSSLR